MIPSTKEDFSNYCLRKLGFPVIQINVSVEQVDDRIDDALHKFYEQHYNASEEITMMYRITETDAIQGYINFPNDIIGVVEVLRPQLSSGASSLDYQAFINEVYSYTSPYIYGDMTYYYMTEMRLTQMKNLLIPDRRFNFNILSHKLIIAGGLVDAYNREGYLIIRCLKKLHGSNEETDTGDIVYNIWRDVWLQNYATALIKLQWGQNMSKFQNVQLLGGVSMNGDQLKSEAKEEILKLEEELTIKYQLPIDFSMA